MQLKKIAIVQRVLPHYRHSFFLQLNERLKNSGIELTLFYGQQKSGTVPRTIELKSDWTRLIKNKYIHTGNTELVWQPCLAELAKYDLVIVEQANCLLLNYILVFKRFFGKCQFAYWGHGGNFHVKQYVTVKNWIRKCLLIQSDWWFAYTDLTKEILSKSGYSQERISVVQNSIDTIDLESNLDRVVEGDLHQLRQQLNISDKSRVAIYCGGIYSNKRMDFLIEACEKIKVLEPNFVLVVIGDGPDESIVRCADETHEWINYVGPKFGTEKAAYFKLGHVMLMPGLVGLAIVDSFCAKLPIITTDISYHSPEIAYLKHGENGLISTDNINSYAISVVDYFANASLRDDLISGCGESAKIYTLGNMVNNYCDGIISFFDKQQEKVDKAISGVSNESKY